MAVWASALLIYGLLPGSVTVYDVSVDFNGDLPIFGGKKSHATVAMTVEVTGLPFNDPNQRRLASRITAFSMKLGEATLPFTVDNIKTYFPDTQITATRFGYVQESDAPAVRMPVRLPGLDSQRFPEITFLPLLLPEAGVEVNKPWTFKRTFGDAPVTYTVMPTRLDDEAMDTDIRLDQDFESLEDRRQNPTQTVTDAAFRVTTHLTGSGTATFDRQLARFRHVKVTATSNSTVTALGDEPPPAPTRQLTTTLTIDIHL